MGGGGSTGKLFSPSNLALLLDVGRKGYGKFWHWCHSKKVGVLPNLVGFLRLLFAWIEDLLVPPLLGLGGELSPLLNILLHMDSNIGHRSNECHAFADLPVFHCSGPIPPIVAKTISNCTNYIQGMTLCLLGAWACTKFVMLRLPNSVPWRSKQGRWDLCILL